MKKFSVILVAAVMCATIGATAYVYAQDAPDAAPKGEKGVLVGDVISVADFTMYGRRGEEHAASGQLQVDNGMPIAAIQHRPHILRARTKCSRTTWAKKLPCKD